MNRSKSQNSDITDLKKAETVSNQQYSTLKRLDFVDSLRGFAALYVLMYHMVLVPEYKIKVPAILQPIILNGSTGVTLFFVISSFTLCYALNKQKSEKKYIRKFYIRRIFRITPLYYVWLLVIPVCMGQLSWIISMWKQMLLYLTFGYNFFPGRQEGFVWASWTLGVEMVFYFIFPFIFLYTKNLKTSIFFFMGSVLIGFIHSYIISQLINSGKLLPQLYSTYFSFFNQLPVFATGIICYYLYMLCNKNTAFINWGKYLLIVGVVLFLTLPYVPYIKNSVHAPLIYPIAMAIVYVVIFVGLSASANKIVVNKFTVFCGTISYSLYLNHPQIIYRLSEFYKFVSAKVGNEAIVLLLCYTITIVLIGLLSFLTYKLIETPGIRLGKRLLNAI